MVIKGDIDTLKPLGALSFCLSGIGLAVTTGQFDIVGEWSQLGTRIEAIGRHNVRFGGPGRRAWCRGYGRCRRLGPAARPGLRSSTSDCPNPASKQSAARTRSNPSPLSRTSTPRSGAAPRPTACRCAKTSASDSCHGLLWAWASPPAPSTPPHSSRTVTPSVSAVDGGANVGRAAVEVPGSATRVGDQPELGRQHHLVAAALECAADEFLVDVRPVDLGDDRRVDMFGLQFASDSATGAPGRVRFACVKALASAAGA